MVGRVMEPRGRSRRLWLAAFLAVAVLVAMAHWQPPRQSAGVMAISARKPMAAMVLPELDGGEWRLADHSGQVVLLNYWATWCEPCRDELPVLLKADREFAPQGLVMVGVSFDSGSGGARAQAVQSFVQRYRVPYAIAFPDARLYVKSSDMELPTTLLVDRHGRIAKTYHGEVDGVALEADIKMLLAES
jgi:cytochrome c biogenesis protein CcmG/thiol:disulfide interchange protein DsbE